MYHDDTHTAITSNDITEHISMTKKELLNTSYWLRLNKVSANSQKPEFMVIGHQSRINEINDLPSLRFNGSKIKRVGKVKSIVVTVDEGLKCKNQSK